jgi:hypothetical protein
MARGGHKYPLLVYRHLLNRWWTPMFAIGLVMLWLAYQDYTDPITRLLGRWPFLAGSGILAMLSGLFFLFIRQIAYVQPKRGYLKVVTPFLRFNISYKRLIKTTPAEMQQLFPVRDMSGWVREIFAPLARQTALVIELKADPLPRWVLRLFLSRFFFKDKTPHLVLLVHDWMRLSTEIESFRSGDGASQPPSSRRRSDSILARLPQK